MAKSDKGFGARGFTVEETPSTRKLAPEVKKEVTIPLHHFHEPVQKEESSTTEVVEPIIEDKKTQVRKPFRPINLKINSPEDEDEDLSEELVLSSESLPKEAVAESNFLDAWSKLGTNYQGQSPSIYAALTTYQPTLDENLKIRLQVDNAIQEAIIFDRKSELLEFLRKELNNYHLQIYTELVQSKNQKKHPDPKEKLEILFQKNPQLKNLCSELGLETIY